MLVIDDSKLAAKQRFDKKVQAAKVRIGFWLIVGSFLCTVFESPVGREYMFCLYTGKSKMSMKYKMFYLLKSVQDINNIL